MVLKTLYIIELTDTEEGGLELVDPSWCPEEGGPPRKKVKSPPVISPTGSSASIYSGGSSSIDWTTTGTTLEMQGTRVTRTQYGFRTLQESSAKMCLKVTGYPLPDITWYKDDVQLHEDERHTFYSDEDGFFAMTIDPVQVTDTGRYTCMATNEYGQASTSAFFRVLKVEKEAAPPAFVTKLRDQECKEGDVIDFECEVEGWPEPELVWLVDDQPLRPSHDFRLQYDGQTAKLEIRDAQPDDTGVYTVKIQNEFGSIESKAELFVQADPDKNHVAPEFQATIEDVECDEGAEVRFKSVITGDPNPEITWFINGKPLSESEKVRFISEDGICILTITDVTRHFDGMVTCQGSNRLGATSCDGLLKVRVPPAPPAFNKPLEDKTVQEKATAVFEVDVSGWPEPTLVFTLCGKELKNGENGVEIVGHDGFFRVSIANTGVDTHDGEIVARAQNEHGSAESRARLTVEPEEEESRSAPTFLKDIEDQTVKSGEQAVFETTVRGHPNPDVTWFINGHKMDQSSPGVKIEAHNHDHKLTVDSAQYAGTVLCRAENAVGRFETKARLVVLAPEKQKKPPRFVEQLVDKSELVDNTVVFEVRVEGEPKPTVEWFLNGKSLTASDRVEIREFDGSIKLHVKNIRLDEAGEIRAVATNSEGTAETRAVLTVQKKPFAPEFDLRPKSLTVEKGSEAVFTAHAFGIPLPTYEWSINGRKVRDGQEGARVHRDESTVDGASILTIDTATYYSEVNQLTVSVIAENTLGTDETGAQLTIEPKKPPAPKLTRDLTAQTVTKTDLAHFEVVVEHATEIKWFLNGTDITTSEGVTVSKDDQFEFRCSIDTTKFPGGTVSIIASNVSGTVETKTELKVLETPKETKKPEFTDKLRDMEVTKGDTVKCDVIALHSPQYKWYLNGNLLEDGKDGVTIKTEENKSSLSIPNAQESGTIRVEASNEVGTSDSSAKLTVNPPATTPIIVDGPKSVTIKETESAQFSATITGFPAPTVKWCINEKVVEESSTVTTVRTEDVYTLKISNAQVTQTGVVKVTAQNSAGQDTKQADLKVEPNVVAPKFKALLTDRNVDEGEPLRWNLELDGPFQGTEVTWLLNGQPLTKSDTVQVVDHGDGTYHVTIAEAKPEMSGTITAKAKNAAGECESSAKVTVNGANKKPEFIQAPQNHETTLEESVKFSAIVTGTPMPNVSWFLNDKKLIQSEEVKVKYVHETGKTSIRIHKPLMEHNGTIRVEAVNVAGKIEATAQLKVDKKTEVPKFTTNMDDRQVKEGENVTFTANVEGYPEPSVAWTLNGEPVTKHANITVTDKDGEHKIEIAAVTPEQAGELSCEATNAVGTKKRDVQLAVKKVGDAPTFAKNLEDRLITEGEMTLMDAKLTVVKPKPKVTWLKDGVEIKTDDHYKLVEEEDGKLQLRILTTKLEDKGRITVKAENDFGAAECTASLGVVKGRPMAKPAFQSDIAPINLTEGDTLECKLLITGDPTPFVKWYINGQLVCATEDTEITNANGVYTMKIHGVTADMTGKIKCVAYNKAGEVSIEGPLKVVAPIPVEFETSLCDATCREGDTLKLKAVLLGEPEPVVSWYVNGKKLEESQNIKIHSEKGTYTVTIKDITCDYSGQVVCEAINEYGKATSEATLLVLPRGEPPDFLEWLSNVRARTGTKVVHKVVFTGDPKPSLTWYINNKEILNSDLYTIVTDNKTSTLTINSFNPEIHVGEIICKAENDAGEVSCTANMITYTSDMFSESESEAQAEEFVGDDLTEDESLREETRRTPTPVMAPKFITKIKDTKAKKGHSAVFECVVPDTKGVCCKWLKDGKEIELIARIRVQTRTGPEGHITEELIIDNVTPEDVGKYTCIVENTAGTDTCEASLTVVETLEKAPNKAPEFLVALQDKTTKTSEKVVLECKVVGEPKPKVSWLHDNKTISQETITVESIEGVERVTITSTELSHQGKYSCVAENSEGTSKTEAFLTVQGEAPVFTKELQNKELSIGEKLILSCSVKGLPAPHVDFFSFSETTKTETKITSSSRIAIEHDQTNTHWRLVISQVTKEDISSYKAVAINSVGTATTTSKVTTKVEAPVFEQGLKTTSVKEKEEIKMEVKVGGSAPDVEWFKDDKPVSEDGNHEIKKNSETGVFTLVVKQAETSDAGKYTAKATNQAGTAESTANAEVQVAQVFEKPTFTKELVTTEVKINESATLSVTVKGVPEPTVEWLKDGQPVQTDSSHVIAKVEGSGNYSITIKDARQEDSGKYACKATNQAGEAKTEANFAVVKDLVPPEFVEKLSPVEVKEKESINLSVTVVGKPEPSVEWFKDDTPINIDNIHVVQKQTAVGSFTLTINDARQEDVGIYSCRARNEAGEALTTANFGIIRDSIPPEFTQKLRPLEVQEQATLDLNVTVIGTPAPSVEWFKDDKPINIDNSHIFAKDDGKGHHTLTIKQARGEDVGVYTCKATNEAGEAKTTANMAVQEEIEAPLFVQGLKPFEVEQGKPAELEVRVEGKPEPEVKWFKDGAPVAIDNVHVIEKKGENGSHTLVIKDTTATDFGKYTCQATNKAGKDETIGELKVPKYSFEKQTAEEVSPLFIEPLKETFASEGDTVVLECKVNKESHPNVQFFKNDVPVEIGQHMQLEVLDDGNIRLTIQNAKKEDVGAYRCEAVNVAGKADTKAELKLKYAAHVEEQVTDESGQLEELGQLETVGETAASKTDTGRGAPEFVELLRSCTVTEKQQAILKCKVKGEPRPKIRWTKEGKEVEMSARVRTEHKEDGTLTLTFDNVTQSDAGEYRCEADNEYGSAWTEGPIIVTLEGAPKIDGEAPDFLQPVKPAVVTVGETAVLEGKVSGKPKPTVKWYKNGEELKPSDRVKIENLDDGTQRLTVSKPEMSDMAEYRCEASNEFGDVWSDVTLTVKEPAHIAPGFFKELSALQVKETETAKFECKVSGTKPDVKWFKDGAELKEDKRTHFESSEDGTQRLVIEESRTDDQGNYRIEVSNDAGVANSKAPLTVVPAETLKIKKGLTDVSITEGTKILLSVEVEGKPKTVKWYKGSDTVSQSQKTKITQVTESEYKLEIESGELSDSGSYRVVLSTESISVESSATVTVSKAAEKISLPSFKKGLNDQQVPKGSPLVLEVEIEGKPKDVKWYKNGDEIKDKKAKIEDLGNGKYRLTIPDFDEKDIGEYSVTAANEAGEIESRAKVNVADDGKDKTKPEIVSGLIPTSVKQGETATFNVKVKGPVKGVKWYKNGKEIPDAKTKDNGDGSYSLEIPNAQLDDAADYKVVVSNDAGDVDSSAALTVKLADDGKDKVKPEIVSGLVPTTVKQGETATFNVKVKGPVKGVKWYKNGKEIPDAKTKDNGDGSYSLEIPNAQLDDGADYKIVVSNDAGDVDSSAALTVKLADDGKDKVKPEIVSGLVPTTVKQGDTATFNVTVKGPVKQVKWYKNGKEIPDAKTKDNGDGSYSLEIPNAQLDDTADYKVVVSNDAGDADSSAALTVKLADDGKDKVKPEIVSGLVPTTVKQGDTATFNVKVKGPVKQVKWYKNGKEIPDAKAKDNGDGSYSLEIPNAQLDDTADYKVVLSNDAGDVDSSAALTVKLPGIEIVKGLEDTEVPKGKKAVLQVETNKKPKEVKWYKNGKEIKPDDKAQAGSDGDKKPQLVIPDADDDDVAEYKVVLTDEDGNTADSFCALTVKLPAEEPKIVKGLEDQTVPVGSPIKLEIETSGSPKTVKWYKNGKELSGAAAKNIKIQKIDDNKYVLEIPASAVEDTGDYKVEVANEAGSANSSGKITVEPKITFLKPLKDQNITEGENAEFTVETNTKPRTVKWYKNGQEIKPDSRFVIEQKTDTKFQLVIKNAVRDDAATYKVVLENTAGEAESSAKLTVKKAKAGLCKIVKGLEDQVVAKGAKMVFEVKIQGEPEEVRWLKDANVITAGANAIIEKIDDTTYRLTIPSADLKDAGEYNVEVINESGKAKSDAKGEVDEKPEIVRGLDSLEVPEGDDDVFKVEVSAPVRQVKWYKNGQEIKPNSHLEAKKLGPKKYELAINRAQIDDGAEYKVVLSNAAGECDSSAALTVVKPNILKIVDGLKDVDVEEPQPVSLKVKVEGIPKVVKWYKNGQEIKPDADGFKFEENPESGEFSLLIPSTKKSDGGAYRVVLGNDKGEVYSGSVVHVKAAKQAAPTSGANFLSPLKDTEVEEGDILTLQCTVGGEPFPEIIWQKDGVVLQKDDRTTMRVALDGTCTLRIRSAKKSDFGQYKVIAKNEAGEATSECKVTVNEQGEQLSKPKFVIPLKTGAALPGDKKEFNVKVRGLPKPTLQWLLNGIPLVFDDRVTLEDMADGNYCLTIRDVREEDFGTLKCIAKNENGSDETVCEFERGHDHDDGKRDDLRYPPRFNVPLWDRRIPVGDPMFIECHVDANPTAEIEWFKDGKKIEHSAHMEIRNTVDGACRIKIIPFEEEDCGVYMCVAVNELGQAETQATYLVEVIETVDEQKKKEYAPRINPPLEDKTVYGGQPIRLSCKVDAIPRASVVWYKDGLPIRADSRIAVQYDDDGTASLAINDSTEADIGAYRCVATNAHGTINTSCSVNVKVPKQEVKKEGEEPFFTKGLVDLWADRGDSFTLKCAVTGDPFPEIKWYRNGQLVRTGPRNTVETSPDGTCTLTVKEATMSDEGIYRCEAENAHGKAKTQATAHVQMALGKTEKPKVDEGKPPKFILELSDMTVSLGNIIDLECKVTGLPNPSVKWSKDGGPLIEDSRFEWSNEESRGVYQLRIKKATVHDEGTYRCVATNENGSATTKSFVKIDDGFGTGAVTTSQPPRFTLKMGDVRTTEGQPLKLECKVDASPLPEMTWYKDGAIVTPSDRIQISLSPEGVATLLIPSCVYDDDGIYRVIATNSAGTAQDKGNATVKKLPRDSGARRSAERDVFDANKAPKVIEPLENVRIPEKQGFRLRCKFSGEPKPTIKWFKDGERVFPYGRLQLIESPDGVCELVIDSAIRQDAGGYRCVAENTYGTARTACDVNVIRGDRKPRDIDSSIRDGKAPGFTTPLTIRRAKPGESVTFECLPFGNPFPSIKWLKDGLELLPSDKIRMESAADGTQRLILTDVNFLSEGYFRCVATNEHGTASTKAELVIDGDRSIGLRPLPEISGEPEECKPRIRRGLYNMSTHEGNVVEMIVCATGVPTPTVKWFKDGQEIISDGPDGKRVIFTDERGIHHLVIVNASPDDEGEYSLEATNKLGSAKTEGSLNIIRPRHVADKDDKGGMPFPPGFVRQLKNKHVFNHMPTIFDCLVVGYPAPEVEWFHNGKKIIPGGRVKIQACGGGSHALIILDTTLEDAGEYVAIAKNSHGTASSSAVLDVTVPFLDNIKFNGEIDVTPYLTEEYGFKKLNTASLPTPPDRGPFIKEVTGHYLTLSWIPTKRSPPRYPQVTYVIEIRELPEKEWTLLDYNIPEPVCKVRNLELGKSYQFRVRAENIYGISDPSPASPPSRLMAPPQPVFDKRTNKVIPLLDPYAERALDLRYAEQYACAPWFAPGVVEKRYCAENDTLTIILNVSGFPDPDIKWKFRGWDIDTSSPTSKCKVYTYGGTETTLAITGFSRENIGQYQCVAKNEYGDAQQNILVDLATRPNFIQPLVNKTFSSAQPMRLDVRVEGEPFPELKWMKEWRPIVESSRIKFVQDGPYLCSLIINDPMWRDSGIYSCVAVNDAGQATTSCTVTVEAEGDYNDVEIPRRRVTIETRRVRELYEISETDEK